MKKYFNDLYKKNIISEILLYLLFYYLILYKDSDILIIINNLYKIINIIIKNNEYIDSKNFDLILIEELYKFYYYL